METGNQLSKIDLLEQAYCDHNAQITKNWYRYKKAIKEGVTPEEVERSLVLELIKNCNDLVTVLRSCKKEYE